jgi:hypothetical protein
MDTISNLINTIFGSPMGIVGFLCGVALIYLVISRTLKRRSE